MNNRISLIIASITLLMSFAQVAAQASANERGFDVNDVTLLFPLNEQNEFKAYPDLGFESATSAQNILSPALFAKIDRKAGALSKMKSRYPYSRWRILGLRYDPCFAKNALVPTVCLEQIRLIAQPWAGSAGFQDVSMHLLFQISESPAAPNSDIINTLHKIQHLSAADTRGALLSVHPGLAKEVKLLSTPKATGPVAALVLKLISTYANEKNLKEVTFTDADFNNDGPWFFMGGAIHNSDWNLQPIAGIHKKALMQTTTEQGVVQDHLPDADVGIRDFMAEDKGELNDDGTRSETELYRLHRTENPERSNPRNTDCASCHLVSNFLVAGNFEGKNSGEFYRSPLGVTGYSKARDLPTANTGLSFAEVVRVLGYQMQAPIVAPLVANSSALVANQLNRILGLRPPTDRDCRGHEIELRACLLGQSTRHQVSPDVDEAKCFQSFCQNP